MIRLFGTDGIRGEAGSPPLDDHSVFTIGRHIARLYQPGSHFFIGMDTRESGAPLARALAGGILLEGGKIRMGGILPTPAVSKLVSRHKEISAGIVISASHNPYRDNGIKIFQRDGTKLPEDLEKKIEQGFLNDTQTSSGSMPDLPEVEESFREEYVRWLLSTVQPFPESREFTLVVDSAHGATWKAAEEVFSALPLKVIHVGNRPDGRNINLGWGSQQPEACREILLREKAEAGLCFDGDGDRVIMIDEEGNILSGDHLIYALAGELQERGQLVGDRIVATVMSNGGLQKELSSRNIQMISCPVGDRNVWETMLAHDVYLGGEQSGHIINRHWTVTGDGLLNALHILKICLTRNVPLSSIAPITVFPQVLYSMDVLEKRDVESLPGYPALKQRNENRLSGNGRIFIRYSGTEPKLRIMVEGEDAAVIEEIKRELVEFFKSHLPLR